MRKIKERPDGVRILGGGCESCPVEACATAIYRGGACMSQRNLYGVGDPLTNADRIRGMTDEELATFIGMRSLCGYIQDCRYELCENRGVCRGCIEEWLKQPAKEENK